jgi:hypothetical protein
VVVAADLNGRTPFFQLDTKTRGKGMLGNVKAQLIVNGKPYTKNIPHFDEADSVFLTQSAIDKFVLPYYMRFKTAGQVGAIENKLFNVQDVLAAFHIPGSILFGFPPKIGVVTLNRSTGDFESKLISGDDDNADNAAAVPNAGSIPNAMKQVKKSGSNISKSDSKSGTAAKNSRKR